jgi:hypothetical protein
MCNSSIVGATVNVDVDGVGGRKISSSGDVVGLTTRWMLLQW